MNPPKQISVHGTNFLEGSMKSSVENANFSDIILKNIISTKPRAIKLARSNKVAKNKVQTACETTKTELMLLRQEIALLKKDILLKENENKKLKLKLCYVKSNIDQFSYDATHDLKEPLRMVTSYLGLLKTKFGSQLDEKANTYIDFAIDGGAKLHKMFNSLLDLSQTGRMDEPKRIIPVNEIIEEVEINISKKIKDARAQIRVIGVMPVLEVYEKSVIKLMEHLLCNAMKFSQMGEVPVIEISAIEKEASWEFCITDNGIGIEANSYKQIFAVFSKLHNSNLYPGNGIGLAICKKAVDHHGGSLWVTSEINKGSKFFFTLPK